MKFNEFVQLIIFLGINVVRNMQNKEEMIQETLNGESKQTILKLSNISKSKESDLSKCLAVFFFNSKLLNAEHLDHRMAKIFK